MLKVEAIINPDRIAPVHDALVKLGVSELSALEIRDLGPRASIQLCYRGSAFVIPSYQRVRLQFIVDDEMLRPAVDAVTSAAGTRSDASGKILVSHVDALIPIRAAHGQRGSADAPRLALAAERQASPDPIQSRRRLRIPAWLRLGSDRAAGSRRPAR